ncbi:hypothetical protein HPB48_012997 [Haemaphysalis longicornis]|uniref:Reverse transcriptase domain-containing protein n=1 Tax=Haemaphysalis longicornis TaxID=44386 RepID=A0A9J6GIF3_HAELO|nr:hypothetical protein HPB48_012997 [Haemaphysalis longicornis]
MKAFDNVDHDAVLSELADTNCVSIMYRYLRDFLQSRTLTMQIGDHKLDAPPHPQGGIPEGAVLSPTYLTSPFSVSISLYNLSPNITIWIKRGRLGFIEDTLQAGLRAVEQAAHLIGLACPTEKTSLLLVHSRHWNPPRVVLHHNDNTIHPQKNFESS